MADGSNIEWCDASWNPLVGCTKKSPGCDNCYAMKTGHRLGLMGQDRYLGTTRIINGRPQWTGVVRFVPEVLNHPLRWRQPKKIFVNSMSDMFHEDIKEEWLYSILAVIYECPWHTFMVLTKRADLMRERMSNIDLRKLTRVTIDRAIARKPENKEFLRAKDVLADLKASWPLSNLWLGVSVENQKYANERIPDLINTPAAIRWLSIEPILGEVNIARFFFNQMGHGSRNLNWVVVGGESGTRARPISPEWARRLRDQCQAAGVAFFFKQWGNWTPVKPETYVQRTKKTWSHESFAWAKDGSPYNCLNPPEDHFPTTVVYRVGKKTAGRMLDGREWNEYPEQVPR